MKFSVLIKNVNGIVEGIKNNIIKDDGIEVMYNERLSICKACPLFDSGKCDNTKTITNIKNEKLIKGCGCHLSLKLRVPNESCPAGKW